MPEASTTSSALPSFDGFTKSFLELFKALGWNRAFFICFAFGLCILIWRLMFALIQAKNTEIARLTEDNHRYRDTYLATLDNLRGLKAPSQKVASSKKA